MSAARALGVAAIVAAVCTVSGCGIDEARGRPDCPDADVEPLVVLAQSVPSAQLVPCVDGLQPGWTFDGVEADQEGSSLYLSSDRGGERALEVRLQTRCSTEGADPVPSDEPGTRRFERIRALEPTYSSVRYYVFPGGCAIYDFELGEARVSALLNEASLMLGFVSRNDLHDAVERATDGLIDDAP